MWGNFQNTRRNLKFNLKFSRENNVIFDLSYLKKNSGELFSRETEFNDNLR